MTIFIGASVLFHLTESTRSSSSISKWAFYVSCTAYYINRPLSPKVLIKSYFYYATAIFHFSSECIICLICWSSVSPEAHKTQVSTRSLPMHIMRAWTWPCSDATGVRWYDIPQRVYGTTPLNGGPVLWPIQRVGVIIGFAQSLLRLFGLDFLAWVRFHSPSNALFIRSPAKRSRSIILVIFVSLRWDRSLDRRQLNA